MDIILLDILTYRVGFTLLLFAQPQLILHDHCSLSVGNILRFLPFSSAVLEPDLDLMQTCRRWLMMLIMENTIVGRTSSTFWISSNTVYMSACCWVTRKLLAISALSAEDRYFLLSKLFSSSKICLPVKVVLIFFFALPSTDVQSRMSSTSESFLRLFFLPVSFVAPNMYFLVIDCKYI